MSGCYGKNGYKKRYKSNVERYKGERKNPECFDPYYDYCGIIGDQVRPTLPFKKAKAEEDAVPKNHNRLPDKVANLKNHQTVFRLGA